MSMCLVVTLSPHARGLFVSVSVSSIKQDGFCETVTPIKVLAHRQAKKQEWTGEEYNHLKHTGYSSVYASFVKLSFTGNGAKPRYDSVILALFTRTLFCVPSAGREGKGFWSSQGPRSLPLCALCFLWARSPGLIWPSWRKRLIRNGLVQTELK